MMNLIAWRNVGKNPCENPPVTIIIAPSQKFRGLGIYPWVCSLQGAVEIFGQEVVDQIGEDPTPITLKMERRES